MKEAIIWENSRRQVRATGRASTRCSRGIYGRYSETYQNSVPKIDELEMSIQGTTWDSFGIEDPPEEIWSEVVEERSGCAILGGGKDNVGSRAA